MKIFKEHSGKVTGELDRILAIGGLPLFTILTIYVIITFGRPIQLTAPILALLACCGYLLIRKRLSSSTVPSLAEIRANPRFYMVLNILFFLLLSLSILSIYLSPEPYTRPLGYFISVALMTAALAVEILFFADHGSRIYFALFKMILIALSLVWSQLLIFPSLLGMDPWTHRLITQEWLATGHITAVGQYSKLPLMHLMSGATMLITGLNYKMTTMLSITLLQVVSDTLFIFLLGRFMFNNKVGLLAALLLGIATYHVRFGIWAIPNTLGVSLIAPVIYLLFKMRQERQTIAITLFLILMATSILTHTMSSMGLAVLLFVFWVGFEIYGRLYREKTLIPVTYGIVMLFAVGMLGYWIYVSGHIYLLARMIGESFRRGIPLYGEVGQYIYIAPFWEQLFNRLGVVLFFALSLIGCLYMISKRFGSSYSFSVALGGVTILFLAYLPPLTGFSIIEGRWSYLGTIMLAIPLGLALFVLVSVLRSKLARGTLLAIGVFVLSFFMIMSSASNLDNRTFSPSGMVRLAFTESEMQVVYTTSDIWEGGIGVDWHYRRLFTLPPADIEEAKTIDEQLVGQDFSDYQNLLILIREEIVSHPFPLFGYTARLDYDPREVLNRQGFSKVYDCGSVAGFVNLKGG